MRRYFYVWLALAFVLATPLSHPSQAADLNIIMPADPMINPPSSVTGGTYANGIFQVTSGQQLQFSLTATDSTGTPSLDCLYPSGAFTVSGSGDTGNFSKTYSQAGTDFAIFRAIGPDTVTTLRILKIEITGGGGGDTTLPNITITSPTSASSYSTTTNSVTLAGTASDNVGVTSVTWSNAATGGSGNATGTTSWNTGSISLNPGDNAITVTAHDAAGNTRSDQITVTYSTTPPPGGDCSTDAGAGTLSNPYKLNNPVGGAYIMNGRSSAAFNIPANTKVYFEVNVGCTGVSYNGFTMWIKGFNNSADFRFYYSVVNKATGAILVPEKRFYNQYRSLQDIEVESSLPFHFSDVKFIYGFQNVGSGTGTSEVSWTGDFLY